MRKVVCIYLFGRQCRTKGDRWNPKDAMQRWRNAVRSGLPTSAYLHEVVARPTWAGLHARLHRLSTWPAFVVLKLVV